MTAGLCAVLLNPPMTSGNRTVAAVARAAAVLGYTDITVTNLISIATHRSGQLATAAGEKDWQRARPQLRRDVGAANALLFGWGVLDHLGAARSAARDQVAWLVEEAHRAGHTAAWTVGEARHPSRWHQFTADRHGRTLGGSTAERLSAVLVNRHLLPVEAWISPGRVAGAPPIARPRKT